MRTRRKADWFTLLNYCILSLAGLVCLIPLIHIFALSLSSSAIASTGAVTLWPKGFTLSSYQFVANRAAFWRAMLISVERIALGGTINMLLVILAAYPLSKEKGEFRFRTVYAWVFFFTMIFNGGMIPSYMVIRQLGLLDKIWALVLPGAVPIFNVVLLLNFFRQVPKEMNEAAFIDGAGHFTTLWRIYVPASVPAIATILLFTLIGHWNSWFDGLLYMNRPENYPMQSYIQTIVVQRNFSSITQDDARLMATISDKTLRSAQIFLGSLPIILAYPFLQRFFVKGIVVGSVKG